MSVRAGSEGRSPYWRARGDRDGKKRGGAADRGGQAAPGGGAPRRIARSLGRSRRWVAKWVARYEPADDVWAGGRKPGRAVNRTDAALEAQVVAVRSRLAEDPWAQIGSDAIAWELARLGLEAPCTRTIERILARAGLVHERRRERPESRGLPYPAPPADRVGDLHQADLVGPRHLDGGMPFVALDCVDIVPHAAAIEIAPDQTEATITASLIRLWERLGVPRRVQLDNGKPFLLGSASLGEIVRVSLHQGTTPGLHPAGRAVAQRHLRAVQRHLRQALLSHRALRRPWPALKPRARVRALPQRQPPLPRDGQAHPGRAHRGDRAQPADPALRPAAGLARAGADRVHPLHPLRPQAAPAQALDRNTRDPGLPLPDRRARPLDPSGGRQPPRQRPRRRADRQTQASSPASMIGPTGSSLASGSLEPEGHTRSRGTQRCRLFQPGRWERNAVGPHLCRRRARPPRTTWSRGELNALVRSGGAREAWSAAPGRRTTGASGGLSSPPPWGWSGRRSG